MPVPAETHNRPLIGYLLDCFPVLTETSVLHELLAPEERGLAIRVFARRIGDSPLQQRQLRDLRAEVEELPTISQLDPWTVRFSGEGDDERVVDRVRRVALEGGEWKHPRFPSLLAEALHLYRRCREHGIRHLHVRGSDATVTARLLRRLGGPTYSFTVVPDHVYRGDLDFELIDGLFSEAAFVVAVCDADLRHLESRFGPAAASSVRRLYPGIDLAGFPFVPNREPTLPLKALAVGRLIERKGFHLLIEAVKRLRDRGLALEAVIVGEGPERPRLARMIQALHLGGLVRLQGARDLDAVGRALQDATMLCLPSLVVDDGDRDALPMVLVEALASGTPVITTVVGGIPEILSYGRAGLLVQPGDTKELGAAMEQVIDDQDGARKRAAAGREQVEHYFDRRRNMEILAEWLRRADSSELESGRGPADAEVGDSSIVEPRASITQPFGEGPAALRRPPRVALVNQEPAQFAGFDCGAAIHLDAIAAALRSVGAEVVRIDESDPERLADDLGKSLGAGLDVVYERYCIGRSMASRLAVSAGLPYVVEVNDAVARHKLRYEGVMDSPQDRQRDAELFGAASAVVAASSEVATYAETRGASPETIRVFHGGVDPELFRPRVVGDPWRRQLVPGGRVVLGFHGRLKPWHGFELIAEAAGRVLGKGAPIHVVVVGDGDFDPILSRRLPSGACTKVSAVPHAEVPKYVAAFDILALGCESEGQVGAPPLKLAEAMSSGVVPIVPGVGDFPEIVGHGQEGWVYQPANLSSLEAGITRLVEDDGLRARLAAAARIRALELSWRHLATFVLEKALRAQIEVLGSSAADRDRRA